MREIVRRLRDQGRLTFAEFMEIALYLPDAGYYAGPDARPGRDYRTSPQTHPLFGALLALQLEQMWRIVGRPKCFTIVEPGAGDGRLCRDVMGFIPRIDRDFARAVEYLALDTVTSRLDVERLPSRARAIVANALQMPLREIVGCVIGNELVDAFPVHRVLRHEDRLYESYVVECDGNLAEELGEVSTQEVPDHFARLSLLPTEDCVVEVNLAGTDYINEAASALRRGFVLTIDYGRAAEELYLSGQPTGSLRCFHHHQCGGNPLAAVGEQDITCDVDFSSLVLAGRQSGLGLSGLTRQTDLLRNLGFDSLLETECEADLPTSQRVDQRLAARELVSKAGLGNFFVLAQHKGLSDPELDGFNPCNDRKRAMVADRLKLGPLLASAPGQ